MSLKSIVRSLFARKRMGTFTRKPSRFRPTLELLEDRLAPAQILTVLNNADSGNGSLRAAIVQANLDSGDTINFTPGLVGPITLTTGELAITKPVTINGPGAALLTIDGNHASRIFDFNGGDGIADAISGLTLTNGNAPQGGAIFNAETLTVSSCVFTANAAVGNQSFTGMGGAIDNAVTGTLTISNSTFTSNTATGAAGQNGNAVNPGSGGGGGAGLGGAVASLGALTITGSTLSQNQVIGGNGGNASGGTPADVSGANGGGPTGGAGGAAGANGSDASGDFGGGGGGGGSNTTFGNGGNGGFGGGGGGGGANFGRGTGGAGGSGGGAGGTGGFGAPNGEAGGGGGGVGFGGAIAILSGTFSASNSAFSQNHALGGTRGNGTFSGGNGQPGGGLGGAVFINTGSTAQISSSLSANTATEGGGIFNAATLALTNSTLSANLAANGLGGGIFNAATLALTNSTLAANSSQGNGGGIWTDGTVALTNSTLSANSSAGSGGGIFINRGPATIANSTLSGNSSVGNGGGIFNDGTATLTNSTLSANSAGAGGGIYNNSGFYGLTGTLSAINCTIVKNVVAGDGGGINTTVLVVTLFNTIVAGNLKGAGAASDISGYVTAASSFNNLIGDPNSAGGLTQGNNGNIIGNGSGQLLPLASILDPTLRNNGGPTLTHALIPGSAAIDAGNTSIVTPVVSEVQTVTLSWVPGFGTGTFSLTFNGPTTTSLNGNSSTLAADTQSALNALSTIGGVGGSVVVTKSGKTLTVTFGGSLANTNVSQMTATGSSGLNVNVATATDGHGVPTDQRGAGFPRLVGAKVDIGAYEMPRALFTDNFTRPNSATLGAPWAIVDGTLGVVNLKAQGAVAGALNRVFLQGFSAADFDLYAVYNVQNSQEAGLIARFNDPSNYYAANVTQDANGVTTLRLGRFVNAVWTELAVAENVPSSGLLRLSVVGACLMMSINGSQLAAIDDAAFHSGSVGMRTLGLATMKTFQAFPITTGVDNFDSFTQPDSTTLDDPWLQNQGYFRTVNNRIRGGEAANVATIDAANVADVDVQASVSITGIDHYAGLLARYQSATNSAYLAGLQRTATGLVAYLFVETNGHFAQLATTTIASVSGNAAERFLVTGTDLKFFVNNIPVFDVLDATLTTGTVGIRSDNYALIDNFSVQAVTTDLPFTDTFTQADGAGLSTHWTRAIGNYTVVGGKATPAPSDLGSLGSLATLVGVNQANVEVQADVTLTNVGDLVNLLACYNGPNDYYLGGVYKLDASTIQVFIFRRTAGAFIQLGNFVNVASISGPIKLRVQGNNLTLFMNGVQQLTVSDNTYASGSVGLRSRGSVTIDNFSATPLAFLPFSEMFSTNNPAGLSSSWTALAGSFVTSGSGAKGTAATNHAVLARLNLADADMHANISVANTGGYAALSARVSSAADADFYEAVVYWTGTQFNADIFSRVAGVFTQLGTAILGSAASAGTGVLRFTAIGGQLTLYFGGVQKLSVYDFSLKSGSAGIRSSLDPTFDAFSVTKAN